MIPPSAPTTAVPDVGGEATATEVALGVKSPFTSLQAPGLTASTDGLAPTDTDDGEHSGAVGGASVEIGTAPKPAGGRAVARRWVSPRR